MNTVDVDVLVVGAGLTGATAAILLARQGISALAVSRSRWVANSPRAHIMNQRTMEVFRTLGLEKAATTAASPAETMANHVMANAVNGPEFGRLWTWGNDPARQSEYGLASPVTGCDLPQDRLEPILVDEAMRLGTTVRFSTMFISLEQDDEGVTSVLEDRLTGERFQVRSRYVIGADGGQSPVADAIGLEFEGKAGIAPAMNIVIRADLTKYFAHRPGSIFWMLQPGRAGALGTAMLRMVEPWDRWVIGIFHLGEGVKDLSEAEVETAVREILQDDEVPIEIEGVYPWRINHVLARQYANGRVFCAGDAVHRHPPMNGLGGNTCIQDAFNLVWKIAEVLKGRAGPGLLHSYEAERLPIGRMVVDAAIAGWHQGPEVVQALGIDPKADPEARMAQFERLFEDSDEGEARRAAFYRAKRSKDLSYHAHGTEMNQVYTSSAVADDGTPPITYEQDKRLHYTPGARPGSRLPHAWVVVNGKLQSTLDLTSPEYFTLMTRERGSAWAEAAAAVGQEMGLDIRVRRIGLRGDAEDLYSEWAERSEIGESGCVLVRPDQFVAWRSAGAVADASGALRDVLEGLLSRS